MKRLTFLLLLISTTCYSQNKFNTYVGLGMGGVIENKNSISNCTESGSLRVAGFISQYYNINVSISIGLQVLTSGDLIATGGCSQYTASTNTRIESSNRLSANSFLLRGRYTLSLNKKVRPYIDLGIGTTSYSYSTTTTEQGSVSRSSLAISPEIGVEVLKRLNIGCTAIFGGKTPSFTGFDSFSNENKILQSIKSQQIYLTASYRLFQF